MIRKIRLALILLITLLPAHLLAQAPAISYPSPQTYRINTPVAPITPVNTGGTVPVSAAYGQVTTFAGSGSIGNANGIGTAATFNFPTGVAIDGNKNIYVVDVNNHLIRKITPAGEVSTFAGNGTSAYANGTGLAASFFAPYYIVSDQADNLYVTDMNAVRKINSSGVVTTLAGSNAYGFANGSGTAAKFNSLGGLCIDAAGNLYVSDNGNSVIRKITPAGEVSTYAGTGAAGHNNGPAASATFTSPNGIAIDAAGNLYITESGINKIRKISSAGIVSDFAGTGAEGHDDGPAASASFYGPEGICTDKLGNVYVTEDYNNTIRKIMPDGQVITLAGKYDVRGDADAIGADASFSRPADVLADNGQLYLADAINNKIRLISLSGYVIDKSLPPGLTFDGKTGKISGTPTAVAAADNYVITAYNTAGSSSATVNLQVLDAGALQTPVITFTIPPNTHADANGNITPNGSSTNTELPVYYTSSDPTKAIITPDGLIHLVGAGQVTITAHQDAGANYNAAMPVDAPISIILSQRLTFQPISNKTVCDIDFPVNVTVSSPSGNPISYVSSNSNIATVSSSGMVHIINPGTVIITAVQAGSMYYLEGTSSQTFTVSEPVNPTISISTGNIPCEGAAITFTANVTNAGSNPLYEWRINNAPVLNNNTNALTSSTLHGNASISCKITNTTDCSTVPSATASVNLIVNTNVTPTVSIASSAYGPVCSGSSVTFTATSNISPADASYQWRVNGNNSGANSPTFTTNTLNNGDIVTCMLTAHANACVTVATATSANIQIAVIANEIPSVSVQESANYIYAGNSVTFTATITNITAAPFYQWQVNGINAGNNSAIFTTNNLKNNDDVTCTITSNNGCVAPTTSLPVIITVLPPPIVNINNTFTPNGDGVNDVWNIPDLSFYPACLLNIYDRAGSRVYQSKGYNKPWDGSRNGSPLPTGTYYYLVKLSPDGTSLSGNITIIR